MSSARVPVFEPVRNGIIDDAYAYDSAPLIDSVERLDVRLSREE